MSCSIMYQYVIYKTVTCKTIDNHAECTALQEMPRARSHVWLHNSMRTTDKYMECTAVQETARTIMRSALLFRKRQGQVDLSGYKLA